MVAVKTQEITWG